MSKTILVTGPDLDPSAAQLVADRGYQTVHTPPYADSAVISDYLQQTGAEGIVSRMGRLDAAVMDAALAVRSPRSKQSAASCGGASSAPMASRLPWVAVPGSARASCCCRCCA